MSYALKQTCKFCLHVFKYLWLFLTTRLFATLSLKYKVSKISPKKISFSISNDLTQMVNFPTRIPDCDSHSPALLDLFLSSDTSICSTMAFPPLGNSDHVVVSVSIDFPTNSQWDTPFYRIPYDYLHAN